jgi:hypothetical protein
MNIYKTIMNTSKKSQLTVSYGNCFNYNPEGRRTIEEMKGPVRLRAMAHYYDHDHRLVVALAQLHYVLRQLVAHCPSSGRAVLCNCILTLAATPDWPELGPLTPFTFTRFFIPCVIQCFFTLPILLFCLGKLASKIFKKKDI